MAIIDQLLIDLNAADLQRDNYKLYDFLSKLLRFSKTTNDSLNGLIDKVSAPGGGGSVTNIITQQFLDLSGGDSGDGGGGDIIPGNAGPAGPIGPQGAVGITSIIMMQEDGIDGESIAIPGSIGPSGVAGATGPTGAPIYIEPELPEDPLFLPGIPGIQGPQGAAGVSNIAIYIEPELPDDPILIPGLQGLQGIAGATGATGTIGIGIDGIDGEDALIIPGQVGPIATMAEFTQDLGVGRFSGTFDLTGLAGLTPGADVTIVQTAQAIASKGNARDEFEMDAIQLTGYVVDANTIRVYWWSPSLVAGIYAFAFAISPGAITILPSALVKFSQIVTTGNQVSVDFINIPVGYTTIKVVWMGQDTTAGASGSSLRMRLNNDSTAADYTASFRSGSSGGTGFSSSVASSTKGQEVGQLPNVGNTTISGMGEIRIPSYAATIFHKVWSAIVGDEVNTPSQLGQTWTASGRWASTAVINRITFLTDGTAFSDGSVFTLYLMS